MVHSLLINCVSSWNPNIHAPGTVERFNFHYLFRRGHKKEYLAIQNLLQVVLRNLVYSHGLFIKLLWIFLKEYE